MKQGWEYKKLGEVCYPKNKIQRATKCFDTSDKIFYIDISSIDNTIQKMTDVISVTFGDAPSRAQQKVEYGDIIVSTVRPNLKNIAIIDRYESNLVASSGFCVLRNTEHVERNYLFHYITSDLFTQHLMKLTTGANYPAVRDQDVRDSIIPIPPKSTQLAIVSELDKINELIRLKKEQLKDYDNLAQSIFYEMFGDHVENEKGWEVSTYSKCFNIGSGGTPSKSVPEYWDNGNIPWIGSNMCQNCIITETDGKFITQEGLNNSSTKYLEVGTVLVALVGATIGKVALLRTPTCTNQNVAFIKANESKDFVPEYVFYNLMGQYEEFMKIGKGDFKMANQAFIKALPILSPPLSLQHLFAQRIEKIEHQKSEVAKAITDLETLLASRMQHWFE